MLWLMAAETVQSGDVLIVDPGAVCRAVGIEVEAAVAPVVVVAQDDQGITQTIIAGSFGWFQGWGRCPQVNLVNSAYPGDWLITSETKHKAKAVTSDAPPPGAFGYALTTGSVPEAYLFGGIQLAAGDEWRELKIAQQEWQMVAASAWITVADLVGPGEMAALWLAFAAQAPPSDGNCAWKHALKITVDGTVEVDTIVGNFFASTFGSPRWSTNHIGCSRMKMPQGESSFYRYVRVPFNSSLKVEVQNVADQSVYFWGQVDWYDGRGIYGDRSRHFKCVTKQAQTVDEYATYTLVDATPGRGRLEGFMLAIDGNNDWSFLEGNVKIYIDGAATPIEYAGTEDAFLGSFYYADGKWQADFGGMTKRHALTDGSPYYQCCFYRFYRDEQLPFDNSIKITWQNGKAGKGSPGDIVNGVYSEVWYYTS
jgi:hypothetical protein